MRYKVGNTQTEIEIGQYRPMEKGVLKAFFSIVEYPTGRKTLDCSYFSNGDRRWFNFPSKEAKKQGQEKPEYIPIISYLDKRYLEEFKSAVLKALIEKESHGQTSSTNQKQTNPLQDDASALWFG